MSGKRNKGTGDKLPNHYSGLVSSQSLEENNTSQSPGNTHAQSAGNTSAQPNSASAAGKSKVRTGSNTGPSNVSARVPPRKATNFGDGSPPEAPANVSEPWSRARTHKKHDPTALRMYVDHKTKTVPQGYKVDAIDDNKLFAYDAKMDPTTSSYKDVGLNVSRIKKLEEQKAVLMDMARQMAYKIEIYKEQARAYEDELRYKDYYVKEAEKANDRMQTEQDIVLQTQRSRVQELTELVTELSNQHNRQKAQVIPQNVIEKLSTEIEAYRHQHRDRVDEEAYDNAVRDALHKCTQGDAIVEAAVAAYTTADTTDRILSEVQQHTSPELYTNDVKQLVESRAELVDQHLSGSLQRLADMRVASYAYAHGHFDGQAASQTTEQAAVAYVQGVLDTEDAVDRMLNQQFGGIAYDKVAHVERVRGYHAATVRHERKRLQLMQPDLFSDIDLDRGHWEMAEAIADVYHQFRQMDWERAWLYDRNSLSYMGHPTDNFKLDAESKRGYYGYIYERVKHNKDHPPPSLASSSSFRVPTHYLRQSAMDLLRGARTGKHEPATRTKISVQRASEASDQPGGSQDSHGGGGQGSTGRRPG